MTKKSQQHLRWRTFWLKIWGGQKLQQAQMTHFLAIWNSSFGLQKSQKTDDALFDDFEIWIWVAKSYIRRMVPTFWRVEISEITMYSHTCTWESILTNASHRRRACTTCSYRSAAPLGHGAALRRSVPKCDFENLKKCARVGKCNFKVTFGGNLVKRASRDKPCTLLVQR